jgi:DNA end-binding protein Ku
MRAIWKGTISFGLVTIPVGLYPATRAAKEIKLRMLRDSDQSPIHYKRVAEADEKEVPWEHIVKGYEYDKDQFVVITPENSKKVNLVSTQTVDIKEFVNLDEIDPCLAKVVIKTREHLAALKPLGKALVLELMHFADELADPKELSLPNGELGAKELAMADTLIDKMTGKWEPENYKDEYREALMKLIEEKIASGGKLVSAKKPVGHRATNVVDLMDVLKRSLEESGAKKKISKPPHGGRRKRQKAA